VYALKMSTVLNLFRDAFDTIRTFEYGMCHVFIPKEQNATKPTGHVGIAGPEYGDYDTVK